MDDQELRTCLAVVDAGKPLGVWANQPAVPATTVVVTNTSGYSMGVEIGVNGATMTNVKVDGVIVGPGTVPRTSGRFRVRNGSTIVLDYTAGTPAWQWFYE
jgi:hypothetical protein